MASLAKIVDVLGGETVFGRHLGSMLELRQAVIAGLPKRAVTHVAGAVAATPKQRRAVIHRIVPEATYKRRRDRLSLSESEKTERLARLAAAAFEVWGEADGPGIPVEPASDARRRDTARRAPPLTSARGRSKQS
jgi:uncharacterized protein (DUF2384 family)